MMARTVRRMRQGLKYVCLAAAFALAPAWAADHALLIGVADYPNLPRRLWLNGPVNDVALVRELLLERGFTSERMRVLVSRGATSQEPTRANIVAAMKAMAEQVQQGDRVFFYLAGHGSQQPQAVNRSQRPQEPDGLDEVFLPADVARWDGRGSQASIPNALLDDEIGEWFDRLNERGAAVWGVFDTCHAAGMARNPAGQSRVRAVSAAEFNLPVKKAKTTPPPSSATRQVALLTSNHYGSGRSLAFAARTFESTAEEWMPRGMPMAGSRLHGVFTWHLVAALRTVGPAAKDALVQAELSGRYLADGRTAPVPQWVRSFVMDWP